MIKNIRFNTILDLLSTMRLSFEPVATKITDREAHNVWRQVIGASQRCITLVQLHSNISDRWC